MMNVIQASRTLDAEHGVVADYRDQFFGYFGWPTVARMDAETLVAVSSGLRNYHVCPFGRTTICTSTDDGESWTPPRVINDTPLDDRDAGIISLGGHRLLVAWFSVDCRGGQPSEYERRLPRHEAARWQAALSGITDENASSHAGSWVRTSDDGAWNEPVRVEVSSPHGPIQLACDDLFYFGKHVLCERTVADMETGGITALRSSGGGTSWERHGAVPIIPGTEIDEYHEPHAVELPGGRILGLIRRDPNHRDYHNRQPGQTDFTMCQTLSDDGGTTWSVPEPLYFHGSPPHLLLHSSGVLICSYGYR